MGVPSFYRWLVNKYPKIVSEAAEEGENGGHALMEFDNLYLDMNGIIHPCFHPEDNAFPPTTFEEVFNSMYEYIDHLFDIVKPKKLLFMAIDGVAPRAKMNQQRARRFRSAKDAEIAEEMEEKLRRQFESEGKIVLPKQESQIADSNVITPGTEFMHMLAEKLHGYISRQMRENPAWAKIKVIFSDDKVPGEGEHKIMSFIRYQRSLPGYDPNTNHCLYGLDADLIMLALATHELHFCILREEVLPQNKQINSETSVENRGQMTENHESDKLACCKEPKWHVNKKQLYQFLNVCILREYLALDLEVPSSDNKLGSDVERLIDDFIFICFFAGNDFLPHMPTLEIHEDCIDLLMHVYKNEFQNLGGYLVDMQKVDDKKGSYIKLKRVERFILAVGAFEEQIFTKRSILREKKLRRILNDFREAKEYEMSQLGGGTSSDLVGMSDIGGFAELKISGSALDDPDMVLKNTKELKQKLKEYTRSQSDLFRDGCIGSDKVKLGCQGFKERYYKEKFLAETQEEMEATRKAVVAKYTEGLCWVLLYYYSGVPSWTWFYPFHYGPFASDLRGLSQTNTKFIKGSPFKPFDQLMGVLPPRSAHALPVAYKGLMSDEDSSIIDFYPSVFTTDVDGKRFMWQGICKLPFIEEERLLIETKKLEHGLKDYEKIRNSQTLDRLFVRCSSDKLLCGGARTVSEKIKDAITIESRIEGVKGILHLMMPEDLTGVDAENSIKDFCMFYEILGGAQNVPRLLEGVNIPEKKANEDDIVETILWHEHHGNANRRFQQQRTVTPKVESSAQNSDHAFVYKGAGTGFSLGRVKQDRPENSISSSYPGCGSNSYQALSIANTTYRGRSDTGHFRPIGQCRPQNSTSSPYRGYGNTSHQACHGRSEARPFRPVGRYRPEDPTSSPYPGYGNTSHQACHGRSEARPFRPVRQYRPEGLTSSPYWGYGNTGHQAYRGRAEAGPFRPVGQYRPENSITSSYRGSGHQVSYQGRSEAGSVTRGGYRGRGAYQNSEQTNAYYASNNRPQQRGSTTFWQPATEDRWSNNWLMESPGYSHPRDYAWSSGPTQHPNPPVSACPGRGRGIGRGCQS